ncbi:MAG: hypothetical protein H5T86_14375, partial [Armatimonadetes bacterium]|nr:hypothetical protein [Armatimonadota bacterium]
MANVAAAWWLAARTRLAAGRSYLVGVQGACPPSLPWPAAPYFAISPDARQIVYWRVVPTAEDVVCGQLVSVRLNDGRMAVLSAPQVIGRSGSLCWPAPSNIVFTALRPLPDGRIGLVWRFDVGTGAASCIFSREQAAEAGRVYATDSPTEVGYVDPQGAVRVPITGEEPALSSVWEVLYRRPGSSEWLELEPQVTLRGGTAGTPVLPMRATRAAWAPGGAAVLLASSGRLFAAPGDLSFARQLTGWRGEAAEFNRLLWRRTVADVVAGTLSPVPALHLASLATQTLVATIFFPTQSSLPELGARVWIARDFERNEFGAVIKP